MLIDHITPKHRNVDFKLMTSFFILYFFLVVGGGAFKGLHGDEKPHPINTNPYPLSITQTQLVECSNHIHASQAMPLLGNLVYVIKSKQINKLMAKGQAKQ